MQPNHLLSAPPVFLKLFFRNTQDLQMVKRDILPLALTNSAKFTAVDAYADVVGMSSHAAGEKSSHGYGGADLERPEEAWGAEADNQKRREREPAECVIDIREHDIAYYLRVAIDLGK